MARIFTAPASERGIVTLAADRESWSEIVDGLSSGGNLASGARRKVLAALKDSEEQFISIPFAEAEAERVREIAG